MAKKTVKKSAIPQRVNAIPQDPKGGLLFFDTDQEEIESIIDADGWREGMVKLKAKFNQEIHEWSKRHGVPVDSRILFKIENNLKE